MKISNNKSIFVAVNMINSSIKALIFFRTVQFQFEE